MAVTSLVLCVDNLAPCVAVSSLVLWVDNITPCVGELIGIVSTAGQTRIVFMRHRKVRGIGPAPSLFRLSGLSYQTGVGARARELHDKIAL